jgi:hypothetical protein
MIAIKLTTSQFFLKVTFYNYSKDINYFEMDSYKVYEQVVIFFIWIPTFCSALNYDQFV